jgi:hypothetical protein
MINAHCLKIKCNVCDKSPVHILPTPDSVTEGTEVLCSSCSKWLATASKNDVWKYKEWDVESDTYYDEDKNTLYKNYPVEYMI